MDAEYVWALLGLLCLALMFTMMALGVRAVRDEQPVSREEDEQ
ncbi:hypothetical protein [Pseudonocardia nigra]|nr:hypothetical protein [Pseudonocardia nigra]